jgi:uncharacterized protein (DUF885 family)
VRGVTEISDAFVDAYAQVDPVRASRMMGIGRDATRLTDYSPEGHAAVAAVLRTTLTDLEAAVPVDNAERLCKGYLEDLCSAQLALIESGEPHRLVSALTGPPAMVRLSFDVMPRNGENAWERVAARLEDVPRALDSYRASLETSADAGRVSSTRVVGVVAAQCDTWAAGWFEDFVGEYGDGVHQARLQAAGSTAAEAYGRLGRWLREEYASRATTVDGVGEQRYRRWAWAMLGTDLDVAEAYEWARGELARLEAEKVAEAERILPGADVAAVQDHLEAGGSGDVVTGVDAYRQHLQEILDQAMDGLDGVEFDIAPELRRCVVGIPPAGTAAAPYYSPPSEDLSQPATTWFPTLGEDRFPMWDQYTTVYHESVPGHHLQLGLNRILPLLRAQRLGANAAHAEGWALYAERLMDELGWFRTPPARFGFLCMQTFRAARVVVDIGLHTGIGGWTYERAVDTMAAAGGKGRAFAESEVLRYLSVPAQATAYKLGERSWLTGRAAAITASGPKFDRKTWHSRALALGPLGLDRLEHELNAVANAPADC